MAEPADLVLEWIRAYNARDVEAMRAVMAPNFQGKRNDFVVDGAENYIGFVTGEWGRFPDARMEVAKTSVAGSRVLIEATWSLTNTQPTILPDGAMLRPKGNKATIPYVDIWDTEDGRLTSDRMLWDRWGFYTQLGYQVTVT